jgi:hypothetical protein
MYSQKIRLSALLSKIKLISSIAIWLLFSGSLTAQRWEAGVFLGGANYAGDLALNIVPSETKPSAGLMGKYAFNEFFAFRQSLSYASISAKDSVSKANVTRNLSFTSDIFEMSSILEFNFENFGINVLSKSSTFYLFGGISVFYFNPKTVYADESFALQPMGLEGQTLEGGKKYSRVSIAVPMGVGYKFNLNRNFVLGVEASARRTYTDFLDDVSGEYPNLTDLENTQGRLPKTLSDRSSETSREQLSRPGVSRGTDNIRDWYFMAGITLTYRFTNSNCSFSLF